MNQDFHKICEKIIFAYISREQAYQIKVSMGKMDTQLEWSKWEHLCLLYVLFQERLFCDCKVLLPVVNKLCDRWEYVNSLLVDIVILNNLILLSHEVLKIPWLLLWIVEYRFENWSLIIFNRQLLMKFLGVTLFQYRLLSLTVQSRLTLQYHRLWVVWLRLR